MTRRVKVTHKLNKIMRLVQEILNLEEEIAMRENAKDFSKAEFIDCSRPDIQRGGYHKRRVS